MITADLRSKKSPTLEEQIKDRWDDPNLKFDDEYIADVMGRLVDLRGIYSLPN